MQSSAEVNERFFILTMDHCSRQMDLRYQVFVFILLSKSYILFPQFAPASIENSVESVLSYL